MKEKECKWCGWFNVENGVEENGDIYCKGCWEEKQNGGTSQ